MSSKRRSGIGFLLLCLLSAVAAVAGPVGELRSPTGDVTVGGKPATGNTPVMVEQVVSTGRDAAAILHLEDGSDLTLGPLTQVRVRVFARGVRPPCGTGKLIYRVDLIAGSLTGDIESNPEAGVEIVTPFGVATAPGGSRVKATTLPDGGLSFAVERGRYSLTNPVLGLTAVIEAGHSLVFQTSPDGATTIEAPATNPGPTRIVLADGRSVVLAPGAKLQIVSADGVSTLTVLAAEVRVGDVPLAPGSSIAYASAIPGAKTSLVTESGVVEFIDALLGAHFDVESGEGVQLSEDEDGALNFATLGTTPLTMTLGGKTVTFGAGSRGSFGCGPDGLILNLDFGRAVVRDAHGRESVLTGGEFIVIGELPFAFPSITDVGVSCGQCGVPDGSGGCTYADALCDVDSCVTGRRCVAGVCTGGRRLTSREDPTCY